MRKSTKRLLPFLYPSIKRSDARWNNSCIIFKGCVIGKVSRAPDIPMTTTQYPYADHFNRPIVFYNSRHFNPKQKTHNSRNCWSRKLQSIWKNIPQAATKLYAQPQYFYHTFILRVYKVSLGVFGFEAFLGAASLEASIDGRLNRFNLSNTSYRTPVSAFVIGKKSVPFDRFSFKY